MKLAIQHHTLLDLLDIGGQIKKTAEAVRFGSWAERNPLAGKMRTCPHCHTRRREGVATVLPCCTSKVAKEFKPATTQLGTLRQLLGGASFARKRRHPHRSAKKLQINEWRLKFEQSEDLMKQVQVEMFGLAGRWTPQVQLGKGAAASLAEQYVSFLRKKTAKGRRARRNASVIANRESRTPSYAQEQNAAQNAILRKNWRKEVGLMYGLGQIGIREADRIFTLYPHTHAHAPA